MSIQSDYKEKGYTEAEVEILLALNTLQNNQKDILKNYVRKSDFEPVKNLVYGLVSIVLIAVASGIVALVIK